MNNIPVEIRLLKNRTVLVLTYGDEPKELSAEFLRVHSPSAEVRGHGVGQDVLQTGKADVQITDLQPVGQYALKISFSDGMPCGKNIWTGWRRQVHPVLQGNRVLKGSGFRRTVSVSERWSENGRTENAFRIQYGK